MKLVLIEPSAGAPGSVQLRQLDETIPRPVAPGHVLEAVRRVLAGPSDPIEELLVRVCRSRTTRFER